MQSAVLMLAALVLLSQEPSQSRFAVIRQAPDFTLTNQDGQAIKLSDFRGKVVLVSFIFTTCNGSCPATTHRLAKVHEAVRHNAKSLQDRVAFLSITLDPVRDTPEALRNYMRLYDLPPEHWHFLTGEPQ